jgi:hypothetical protein
MQARMAATFKPYECSTGHAQHQLCHQDMAIAGCHLTAAVGRSTSNKAGAECTACCGATSIVHSLASPGESNTLRDMLVVLSHLVCCCAAGMVGRSGV